MAKAKAPKKAPQPLPQLLHELPYPEATDETKGKKTHQICDKVANTPST